jgi:hypothetical protein
MLRARTIARPEDSHDQARAGDGATVITPVAAWYLAIDGAGAPDGAALDARVEALQFVARALRHVARSHGHALPRPWLELHVCTDLAALDGTVADAGSDAQVPWRLLLPLPDAVCVADLQEVAHRLQVARHPRPLAAAVSVVRLGADSRLHALHLPPMVTPAEPSWRLAS